MYKKSIRYVRDKLFGKIKTVFIYFLKIAP